MITQPHEISSLITHDISPNLKMSSFQNSSTSTLASTVRLLPLYSGNAATCPWDGLRKNMCNNLTSLMSKGVMACMTSHPKEPELN